MPREEKLVEIVYRLNELYSRTVKHSSGRILGSMTTQPHSLAVYSYLLFIHTNLSDPVMYPVLNTFKEELLLDFKRYYGERASELMVTSGGSESNFTAILSAWKSRGERERVLLAPDTVHSSVDKACDVIGCRLVKIPTGGEPVEPSSLHEHVRKHRPFAVVITAGTTERGLVDPVKEAAEVALETDTYLHVDAAYGGLIVPHLYKHGYVSSDLQLFDGVSSVAIDFHKNGLAPIPSSVLLFSDERQHDLVCYEAEYTLAGKSCGLLGTRPGASLAAIWAAWNYFGWEGYEELALKMIENARYLYYKLSSLRGLIAYRPILPIVVFKHREVRFERLLERLLERGYYLYKSPSLESLRVVVMPHVEREHIDEFVEVLSEVLSEVESGERGAPS